MDEIEKSWGENWGRGKEREKKWKVSIKRRTLAKPRIEWKMRAYVTSRGEIQRYVRRMIREGMRMPSRKKLHGMAIVIYTLKYTLRFLHRADLHERDTTFIRNSREPINDARAFPRSSRRGSLSIWDVDTHREITKLGHIRTQFSSLIGKNSFGQIRVLLERFPSCYNSHHVTMANRKCKSAVN